MSKTLLVRGPFPGGGRMSTKQQKQERIGNIGRTDGLVRLKPRILSKGRILERWVRTML